MVMLEEGTLKVDGKEFYHTVVLEDNRPAIVSAVSQGKIPATVVVVVSYKTITARRYVPGMYDNLKQMMEVADRQQLECIKDLRVQARAIAELTN